VIFDYELYSSLSIRVSVSDGVNPGVEGNFTVTITDVNENAPNSAPSGLSTSGNLVMQENEAVGTIVGTFQAQDPDGDSLTYSLVSGVGDGNNSMFTLENNGTLKTAVTFDYELYSSLNIRVSVSDGVNPGIEGNFTVTIHNVIEDFDKDGIENAYDPDDDNDGISDLDEIAFGSNPFDPNDAYTVPIIRTLGSTLHAIDSLLLKGEVPEDQVSKVSEVGFLLSPKIFFDNPQVITLNTIPETGNIELSINPQMYPNGIYFRLFAKNPAGTGLGAIKRFRPNTNQSINKWWGNSETSEEGWQRSDWFGNFLPYENGWMYHLHMGWMFSSAEESDSIWLWNNYHKWLWTSKEVFPFLYSWEDSSWLFAYFHKNGSIHYFNYASDSYE
jgi:hypothetical protein